MTPAPRDELSKSDAPQKAGPGPAPNGEGPRSLRGPAVAGVGRTFWLVVSALGLVAFAVVIVVSFVATANDNARITRLKTHGIPVAVTVTGCIGNLGGSGSNAAGFTCHGSYVTGGVHYDELIGSLTVFTAPGSVVRGVVDPSHHGSLTLQRALRTTSTSTGSYVVEGLLAVLWLALTLLLLRVIRRVTRSRKVGDPPHATFDEVTR